MIGDNPPTDGPSTEAPRTFELHDCLGRGGFGEVYHAVMRREGGMRAEVAVKVLHLDVHEGSQALQRLKDEARLLGALNHPSVLQVYDLVELSGRVALVTEFVDGQDLSQILVGDTELPITVLLEVMSHVADALNAAWTRPSPEGEGSMNLIHRDVKPANIILGKHGQVKLIDFGIARADNFEREAHTEEFSVIGSYQYMAPERLIEDQVGPEVDVYSIGCTLYECMTGEHIYKDMSLRKVYRLLDDPDAFKQHFRDRLMKLDRKRISKPVRDLVARCLHPQPNRRPTAAQLAREADDMASNLKGPTLRRWAADREWPDRESYEGQLAGSIITEGTLSRPFGTSGPFRAGSHSQQPSLERVKHPGAVGVDVAAFAAGFPLTATPVPAERDAGPGTSKRGMIGWALFGAVLLLPAVILLSLGAIVGITMLQEGAEAPVAAAAVEPEPASAVPEPEAPAEDPEVPTEEPEAPAEEPEAPAVEPDVPAEPVPAVAVAAPQPEPAPAAQPTPAVAQPEPAPVRITPTEPDPEPVKVIRVTPVAAPAPAPAAARPPVVTPRAPPARPGTLRVFGDARVELRSGEDVFGPGMVPSGAYQVYADFGTGPVRTMAITIPAGGVAGVECKRATATCTAR